MKHQIHKTIGWGVWLAMVCSAMADSPTPVREFFTTYCIDCHGADEQNAGLRLDHLAADASNEDSQDHIWPSVFEAIAVREMPPEEASKPTPVERRQILEAIVSRTSKRAAELRRSSRRINRRELSATLQDVTGVPIDFGAGLPVDGKIDGFDTGTAALQDAADSVSQWLEVTRRAVESIRFLEPARDRIVGVDFREHNFNDFRKFVDQRWKGLGVFTRSKRLLCEQGTGLYLKTQWSGDRVNSFLAVPAPKDKRAAMRLTLRVRAQRPIDNLPTPTLWVKVGGKYLDYVRIGDEAQTLSYFIRMEDHTIEGDVIKIVLQSIVEVPYAVEGFENDDRSKPSDKIPGGVGIYRPKFDRKKLRHPSEQPVPSIIVESVEIDYDYRAKWPPASWKTDEAALGDDDESARRLLHWWLARAWRRPVTDVEQTRFFALYTKLRGQGFSFDAALRSAFQSVLMGGPFRYLSSPTNVNGMISQHAAASRLSFMLIGAPPDEELRRLAAKTKLNDPDVLDAEIDRLLADPRSNEFFHPFVTQWFSLEQPITLTQSHIRKQDFRFGRHLKASMKLESIEYVARLFRENRPARELIASDWTVRNDILSVHYNDPVAARLTGAEFRRVALRSKSSDPRGGGLLGHAGIQSMLCWMGDNWVIYRGSWMLDRILDDPPPPPPLEVPELIPSDKENHGKSFRELLALHQQNDKCSVCHRKIDPLGFAFQNFDLSGRWRTVEHERYHRYELDGKVEWRGEGESRPVDSAGTLPRGERFANFQEFKKQLTKNYTDDIVRGLMKKLTLYGTGRSPDVHDLVAIRTIMKEQSSRGYRLKDLLKALIRTVIIG